MTQDELIELVRQMRLAQCRYFLERSRDALNEAKELERRVDRALAGPTDQPRLPGLEGS